MIVISVEDLEPKRSRREDRQQKAEDNSHGLQYTKPMCSPRMHSYTDRREQARPLEAADD